MVENKLLTLGEHNDIRHEEFPGSSWFDFHKLALFDIKITAYLASFPNIPETFDQPKGLKKKKKNKTEQNKTKQKPKQNKFVFSIFCIFVDVVDEALALRESTLMFAKRIQRMLRDRMFDIKPEKSKRIKAPNLERDEL